MSNFFDRMASDDSKEHTGVDGRSEEGASSLHAPGGDATDNTSRTPSDVKQVTQELLKHGYLEEVHKTELFRSVVLHEREIMAILEPLDLVLRLDSHRGVAFLVVAQTAYENADDDVAWAHPSIGGL